MMIHIKLFLAGLLIGISFAIITLTTEFGNMEGVFIMLGMSFGIWIGGSAIIEEQRNTKEVQHKK